MINSSTSLDTKRMALPTEILTIPKYARENVLQCDPSAVREMMSLPPILMNPIVITYRDERYNVIAGFESLVALEFLKIPEVEVIIIYALSLEQEEALFRQLNQDKSKSKQIA